jgi:hypothetical protein
MSAADSVITWLLEHLRTGRAMRFSYTQSLMTDGWPLIRYVIAGTESADNGLRSPG